MVLVRFWGLGLPSLGGSPLAPTGGELFHASASLDPHAGVSWLAWLAWLGLIWLGLAYFASLALLALA